MTSEPIRDPVSDPLLTPQNAALIVIEKAAHSPNMEQPEPTARALLDFWGPA